MTINLLPWREIQAQRKIRKQWFGLISAVLLTVLIWGVWQTFLLFDLQQQKQQLQSVQKSIQTLAPLYQQALRYKQQAEKQNEKTQFLQERRAEYRNTLSMLMAISKKMPQEAYLTAFCREGETIRLSGYAPSHIQLADLLKNLTEIMPKTQPIISETKIQNHAVGEINFDLRYEGNASS